jgi:hypothetical protein
MQGLGEVITIPCKQRPRTISTILHIFESRTSTSTLAMLPVHVKCVPVEVPEPWAEPWTEVWTESWPVGALLGTLSSELTVPVAEYV